MKAHPDPPKHWSRHEWELINVTELFQHKPAIMKKAEGYLEQLRLTLADEIQSTPGSYPPETDLTKGQIAKGENHKGFPFISLDLPQKFSKTEFFTYRTLFWWGHYLGFSLILKGPHLNTYTDCLKQRHNSPPCQGVYVSRSTNPWEWEFQKENFSEVTTLSPDEIQSLADQLQYLKLIRIFPVTDKNFLELDWNQAGLQSFRDLMHCILE